jgi:hypothetical protein
VNARQRVQALALGRGDGGGIAVPLALASAARIQEREWEEFTEDPTQLANGLRDLHSAVAPDGLVVTDPDLLREQGGGGLLAGAHAVAAVEATKRLRASLGDQVAVVVVLPVADPAVLLEISKEFLAAGADILLVLDDEATLGGSLGTLANVARFHQAVAASTGAVAPLARAIRYALASPEAADGIAITSEWLPRDTDLTVLEDWVDAVRG